MFNFFNFKNTAMKSGFKYVIFSLLLQSCASSLKYGAISKIEEYNEELEQIAAESTIKIDTALINAQFDKNDIASISGEMAENISHETSFKNLLTTEKDLLNQWNQIEDFKNYDDVIPDSLLKLIRGCSSFDRAPLIAERVPSARGMKSVSLNFYRIQVPVAFHIIVNSRGEGQLTQMTTQINDQISILNNVYNKFNISFKLISTNITVNDFWFDRASYYTDINALKQMTSSLSLDPANIMNVYTLGSKQVLGEATYPWYDEKGTTMDYVVINYNTLPGGSTSFYDGNYNEGKTLVHEVGHFLGLFHTFEGGNVNCDTNPPNDGCVIGDQVDDTPSQRICYFSGCNEDLDSCPSPGKDPVKNFMGYNPDACMNEMTVGQGERLLQSIIKFRYYLIVNPI